MKDKGKRRNQKWSLCLLYSQVAAGYLTSKDLKYKEEYDGRRNTVIQIDTL